jgi:hypothetical protein
MIKVSTEVPVSYPCDMDGRAIREIKAITVESTCLHNIVLIRFNRASFQVKPDELRKALANAENC